MNTITIPRPPSSFRQAGLGRRLALLEAAACAEAEAVALAARNLPGHAENRRAAAARLRQAAELSPGA